MANKNIVSLGPITVPLMGTEVIPIWNGTTTTKVTVADLTAGRDVSAKTLTLLGAGSGNLVNYQFPTLGTVGGVYVDSATIYFGGGAAAYTNSWYTNHSTNSVGVNVAGITRFTIGADGNLTPNVAAKGINFTANTPAAGMTSQLLNWYEEGTWTPVLTPNTSGTITIASPTNSLNYTRVGRLVTLTGRINISSVSSPLGLLILSGLPISSGSSTSNNSGAGAVYSDTITTASALSFRIAENATAGIIATPNQGDAAPLIQAGSNLYINIAYTV